LYLPFNCSSQISFRLSIAVTGFRVCPATYKRRAHLSPLAFADCLFRLPVFDVPCLVFTVRSFECGSSTCLFGA
jgi:hypothetical protein